MPRSLDPAARARRSQWANLLRWAWFALVGLVAAMAMDEAVWRAFSTQQLKENDMLRLVRAAGYAPAWLLLASAFFMIDWHKRLTHSLGLALRRGLLIIMAVAAGGIAAELGKILFRRERPPRPPDIWDGHYTYRSFLERTFDAGGLGLPSSHTAVAFAGCWMLCYLYPRATPIWLLIAAGCGLSRIADHAHFFSDVYLAATMTGAIVGALWLLQQTWRWDQWDPAESSSDFRKR